LAKLITRCPQCSKQVEIRSEERVEAFGQIFKTYSCGHTICEEIVAQKPVNEGFKLVCKLCLQEIGTIATHINESHDPIAKQDIEARAAWIEKNIQEIPSYRLPVYSRAMNFQQTGVDFIEQSNFNCAILDEMGLGKTIQVLLAALHHKDKFDKILFVVKPSLKLNWANEMTNNHWLCNGNPDDYPFILMDGKSALIPGFRYYVVGYSALTKFEKELKAFGFKLLVVDESQNFANTSSKRTKALLEVAKTIPHRICMSGTPILNRASEYWPTLNLIKPDHWPNYAAFVRNWIEVEEYYNEKGNKCYKMRGIKDWRRAEFFRKTSPYIIRRMKRDVLKDLPAFSRRFKIVEIEDSSVADAYNEQAIGLDNYLNSEEYQHASGFDRANRMLAYLVRMRHLCGIAKVPLAIEEAREFLESSEETNEKLIIGVHHDAVFDQLKLGLAEYNPVMLGSGLDNIERNDRIEEFRSPTRRVAIAKILAQGEGLNLQFCNRMIVLERQWNPGKEEQFEARIDRYGQIAPTTADYLIAKNTVDVTFTDIVEDKRQLVGETLSDTFDFEMDEKLLTFLAEGAAKTRL